MLAALLGWVAGCDDDPKNTTSDTGMDTVGMDTAGMDTAGMDTTGVDTTGVDTSGGDTGTDVSIDPVGLTARPSNPNCVAPVREVASGPVTWTWHDWGGADNLNLMMMRQTPAGDWIEIYREGGVYVVDSQGQRNGPLLNITVNTEGEMGLLGFDIHPDWPSTPELFFYYVTLETNVILHIDRYTANPSASPITIDSASRTEIWSLDRGFPWNNHVGGTIEFDPLASTPTLYLATGDGEQQDQVMNLASQHGKMMRIDVSSPPYTPEIVAMGLRNPFRWSFDSQTGDLWIGDVGDDMFEEIDFLPRNQIPGPGGTPINFGWPVMEGFHCRTGSDPANSCGHSEPLTLPVHAYGRNVGVSVIGGRAYRGSAIAGIDGHYFFNDIFVQNGESSWQLFPNTNQDPGNIEDDYSQNVLNEGGFVGYTEDNNGEIWAFAMWGGIWRLEVGESSQPAEPMPSLLSETGCFDTSGAPGAGLVPYDLNAPLWSDGATKARWLALPDGESITIGADGDFEFPVGTVLAKEFTQEGVRVETRLFVRHPDGVWAGYSYAWVDGSGNALTDAELLPEAAATRPVPGTSATWTYPSRNQCLTCHTEAAGRSLGVEVGQLNRELTYPSTGITANQLDTLAAVGMIDDPSSFGDRAFPNYDDTSIPVADRVWSYLHSNCSNCHRVGGSGMGGRSAMPSVSYDLFADRSGDHPLEAALCGVVAGSGDLGLGTGAQLVEPGLPGDWSNLGAGGSVLYLRMAARPGVSGSTGAMPLIGSEQVDDVHGLPLTAEWIQGLNCP